VVLLIGRAVIVRYSCKQKRLLRITISPHLPRMFLKSGALNHENCYLTTNLA